MQFPATSTSSSASHQDSPQGGASDLDVVEDLFAGLPFELPANALAAEWLDELDFVDPYMGSLQVLEELATRAPSHSAAQWLRGIISARGYLQTFERKR